MKSYRVRVSRYMTYKLEARDRDEARRKVWDSLERGYTYGWEKADFLKRVKVEVLP